MCCSIREHLFFLRASFMVHCVCVCVGMTAEAAAGTWITGTWFTRSVPGQGDCDVVSGPAEV